MDRPSLLSEGFNFKLPDEFNKPTDQMGRMNLSPPPSFYENPFSPKKQNCDDTPSAEKESPCEEHQPPQPCPPAPSSSVASNQPAPAQNECEKPCPPQHTYTPRTYYRRPSQNRNRFFETNDC